jgi:hypothetical protein
MKLSPAQVQRFWREWSAACAVLHWTRADGLSAAEIDARRKEFLARCGFSSLTQVDRVAGFTKVLNELLVLQGVSLAAARETLEPALNEARVLRHHILTEQVPCLELYLADVRAYLTAIIADKTSQRPAAAARAPTLMDLDAGQLRQLQYTLAARLNDKRRAAGDTLHEMKTRAGVRCACARCRATSTAAAAGEALRVSLERKINGPLAAN